MVLLASSICSKSGKTLVSRQFVEMTRSRIEGLLTTFIKLMESGDGKQQHTYIETESVRYVYQPIDGGLYIILITTTASNILEDLETLRLFSRVVSEYCTVVSEHEVLESSFQLIFAFDEIVALGYRENVNMTQIRTFIEMDSYDEKVYLAQRKNQEREAAENMKRKALELQLARKQQAKRGGGRNDIYSSSISSSSYSSRESIATHAEVSNNNFSPPLYPSSDSTRPQPSRGMKLTPKSKGIEELIYKIRTEEGHTSNLSTSTSDQYMLDIAASSSSAPSQAKRYVPIKPSTPIHIIIEEKLSITANRTGGLDHMEVNGLLQFLISDPALLGSAMVNIDNKETRGFQMQTHPNIDKKLFLQNSIITIKPEGKPFVLGEKIGVLKWRFQTTERVNLPLIINCWPTEGGEKCDVIIEYDLNNTQLSLSNVSIIIPLPPSSNNPIISDINGSYQIDSKKHVLNWNIPVIDDSNSTGSIEFSVIGLPTDFFPIDVNFSMNQPFINLTIAQVNTSPEDIAIKYSQDFSLEVEKYSII